MVVIHGAWDWNQQPNAVSPTQLPDSRAGCNRRPVGYAFPGSLDDVTHAIFGDRPGASNVAGCIDGGVTHRLLLSIL